MKDTFGCDELALRSGTGGGGRMAARHAVASRAIGGEDLRLLLDMLGLWPDADPPDGDTR
ncbi:hypothetical protein [Streptomyces sp. NPDC005533]|uniref:hypothetical protein n=1 Tax=Streptomyces sp. NPDC005533 TaxID=3364723 RepID=UPI003676D79B